MTVREFIDRHSSSKIEKETAMVVALNFLDSEIIQNTSDNNFAAGLVACWDEDRELILNGRDTTFEPIA